MQVRARCRRRASKTLAAWDSLGHSLRIEYDELRRPLRSFLAGAATDNPNREWLTERRVMANNTLKSSSQPARQADLHLDQAGLVSNEAHDFKGNTLHTSPPSKTIQASRRLASCGRRSYRSAK